MPNRCEPCRTAGRSRLDINTRRLTGLIAVIGSVALGLPAASQLLDALDDVVDQQITEQVEEDVAEALEDAIEQQVESEVAGQIQEDVTGAIEQALESEIVDAVQEQVESGVVAEIVTQVEESVAGEIGEQLLDTVESEIGDIADDIDDIARDLDEVPGELLDTARGVAETAVEIVDPATESVRRERFAADVDASGRTIEGEVWIILVPSEHAERIASWGFTIRERQGSRDARSSAAARRSARGPRHRAGGARARARRPGHRGRLQSRLPARCRACGRHVDGGAGGAERRGASIAGAALSVGIVDTAVAVEHEALQHADIVQRDFVPFTDERPTAHGTAVASILIGDSAKLRPQLRGGRVYVASVFFTDAEGDDATTADSLTVAGEWLATEGVRVINMSLAGPPNRVLEAAIAALVERGVIVVAAVGNNGPTGAPLYPAAYADGRGRDGGRRCTARLSLRQPRPARQIRGARRRRPRRKKRRRLPRLDRHVDRGPACGGRHRQCPRERRRRDAGLRARRARARGRGPRRQGLRQRVRLRPHRAAHARHSVAVNSTENTVSAKSTDGRFDSLSARLIPTRVSTRWPTGISARTSISSRSSRRSAPMDAVTAR